MAAVDRHVLGAHRRARPSIPSVAGVKGTLGWVPSVVSMIWSIVLFPFLKSVYEIWLEFWFMRIENGETFYKASWKKIWAQAGQIVFYAAAYGALHMVIEYLKGDITKEQLETIASVGVWR